MNPSAGQAVLESALHTFRSQKKLAERAIEQLDERRLHQSLNEHTNSIAVIVKHVAGNMRSRWTDFLTSDGEKTWRNRDGEFTDDVDARRDLMHLWETGWTCLFKTLESLRPEDLTRTVRIRGAPHTVVAAIHRQLDHYGYHVGQIVQLARVLAGERWTTLTIPRGGSADYNRRVWQK